MRRPFGWVALALALMLGLSACQAAGSGSTPSGSGAATAGVVPSESASPEPVVTFSPASGTTDVRPDAQVIVSADDGTLTSVLVRSKAGKQLPGELDPISGIWHSRGILLAGTDYTVTAVASSERGKSTTETSTFSTLKPSSTVGAVMIPGDDWTVGVGMPVVVQFSRTVKNRDAAVRALTVRSSPQVEGAWHWMSGQAVWWRPKEYWPAGTKVEVTAALNGAELADDAWGKRTYTTRFTVGSSIISTVDVKNHTLTVTKDGKVVRTLPVTTGLPQPKYRTRSGVKVIMDKKPVEQMDAASTGTQKDDPEYYNLRVQWAMRLTWSGEYIHAAPWSVGSQGRANVSHGCTGMSTANAKWMYDYSKIGDVVVYKNSPRALEPGNGYTAWELTWDRWADGSGALSLPLTSAASTDESATRAATGSPSASPSSSAASSAASSPPVASTPAARLVTPPTLDA